MLSLGFGGGTPEDPDDPDGLAMRMMKLLEEHGGWDFTYGRDPVLILIEIEEYLLNPNDESE